MNIRYENLSDIEYINYLNSHISNVYKSFLQVERILAQDVVTFPNISQLQQQLRDHDSSKYRSEEWEPYRNYFYPTERCPKDEEAFDTAWLHHQHNNPHHWQHWTLIRDSGEIVGLDMPVNYVIEMLCDWHSFSATNPESTAYRWWKDNQSKMKLSKNTIDLVNKYIEYFKEPLN